MYIKKKCKGLTL